MAHIGVPAGAGRSLTSAVSPLFPFTDLIMRINLVSQSRAERLRRVCSTMTLSASTSRPRPRPVRPTHPDRYALDTIPSTAHTWCN